MGGNALGIKTRRLDRTEYLERCATIRQMLLDKSLCVEVVFPRVLDDKETFGDIDIIAMLNTSAEPGTGKDFGPQCAAMLQSNKWTRRGKGVWSFEWDGIQVDVNTKPTVETLMWTGDLHSFGDLGMLVGVMAKRLGLKFGGDGLYLVNSTPTPTPETLPPFLLTTDFHHAMDMLGFCSTRWEGLKTVDDVCRLIVDNRYFHPSMFSGFRKKTMDDPRGRPMALDFLTYLDTIDKQDATTDQIDNGIEHPDWIDHFGKREQFKTELVAREEQASIRAKFNGSLVRQWTGLEDGQSLGKFLRLLKESRPDIDEWVCQSSVLDIQQWVLAMFRDQQ